LFSGASVMESDVGALGWPPKSLVKRIAVHIAGDICMSEHPGSVLRKWRDIFGASQLEVARRMGVTSSVISDYEKGRRNPGSLFVKRFVEALLDIDSSKGWPTVAKLMKMFNLNYLNAVVSMDEFEEPVPLDAVVDAVKGVVLVSSVGREYVYGYTVVDSIKAIMSLEGGEFLNLLGTTSQRVVVFTKVSTGRSPMIALKVSTIKPAVIVLHGLKKVDHLALWIAESERVPLILSTARSEEELVEGLRRLASSPR